MTAGLRIAIGSEDGKGMGAALHAVDAIVQRNVAVFASLEQAMANHRITHLAIGGLQIECAITETVNRDDEKMPDVPDSTITRGQAREFLERTDNHGNA